MDSILQSIEDWFRELLVSGIMNNIGNTFDSVNNQVGQIATEVGTTPAAFSPAIFNMIRTISENVIMPIAGIILTFIAVYELIQLVIARNNLAHFETWIFWKWIFKAFVAVTLITNTMNITMAIFEVAQYVVNNAGGIIGSSTAIDVSTLTTMQSTLEAMDNRAFAFDIFAVICGAVPDLYTFSTYLCHRICENDRELSYGQPCADTLCDLRKQGAGHDWTKLLKVTICTGIPGIFDHDRRRYICGTHTGNSIYDRYHSLPLGCHGLHDPFSIYAL